MGRKSRATWERRARDSAPPPPPSLARSLLNGAAAGLVLGMVLAAVGVFRLSIQSVGRVQPPPVGRMVAFFLLAGCVTGAIAGVLWPMVRSPLSAFAAVTLASIPAAYAAFLMMPSGTHSGVGLVAGVLLLAAYAGCLGIQFRRGLQGRPATWRFWRN
ncbi:MAG: hypothetical protein JWM27_1185 [Gemmatimonadetes bacterium]|nr:hypothetical protein [Gemmatimonadota bacterium]